MKIYNIPDKQELFRQQSKRRLTGICPLDGEWDFFYSAQKLTGDPGLLPDAEKFTGKMVTPGYWDDWYELFDEQDFFGDMARFNPDYRKPHFPMANSLTPHASSNFLIGTGYYRKVVDIDLAENAVVILNVGPAVWECKVFCNRQLAGSSNGYSTASEFDLTGLLKADEPNELIIAVCNVHDDGGAYCRKDGSHDGEARGARPGQHRGLAVQGYQSERAGIGGGVYLQITRSGAIRDSFVYLDNNRMVWETTLLNGSGKTLQWQITGPDGLRFSGTFECQSNTASWQIPLPEDFPFWSDTDPVLMQFALQLLEDSTVLDKHTFMGNVRSFTAENTDLFINGKSVFLRGVTEHCYFPESCNAHFSFEKYMHDLGILKKAGFNFIRCHTWCPPEPFYDACDALGIFVQTELPVVWSEDEAEAILKMIRRHPSAVILCEGNEKRIDQQLLPLMKKLVEMMHSLAPGMLFNPQEAMRSVEYDFTPDQKIAEEPFPHDPERLAEVRDFSDVYGGLCCSMFSYSHEQFPGTEEAENILSVYQLPCLAHEIGILGGYLDFSLEKRYENTFIGTDLFAAARENMQKHGVWHKALEYYQYNSLFISSLRKQLFENLRSCRSLAGYDYLGGIDTHWHLTGYPCGVFNEFYEEKYGESIGDILRYNNSSVLLWSAGKFRSFTAGETIEHELQFSCFEPEDMHDVRLDWQLCDQFNRVICSGTRQFDQLKNRAISCVENLHITLPESDRAQMLTLHAVLSGSGKVFNNQWKLWVYPAAKLNTYKCRVLDKLTDEAVDFLADGGAVLLTGEFPCGTELEMFRPHTSGRSLGHSGAIIRRHPVWEKFPNESFADWQFFPMMNVSCSIVNDKDMPEFKPLLELIPSFKRIRHKSMLAEYKVGKGRLMLCTLHIEADDPAARYLGSLLKEYLSSGSYASDVPEWTPEKLRHRLHHPVTYNCQYRKIDAGGRPVEY